MMEKGLPLPAALLYTEDILLYGHQNISQTGLFVDNHLAVSVKVIVTDSKTVVLDEAFAHVEAHALRMLMSVIDEVIVIFKFDQLIRVLTSAVEVEVAVICRTVLEYDLAVCVKGIVSGSKVSAGYKRIAEVQLDVLGNLMTVADEVIVTLILDKLVRVLANVVNVEVAVILRSVLDGFLNDSLSYYVLIIFTR